MNIGKYTGFLIKFLLFATILYLVWMPFAITYYLLLVNLQIAYFHLIGIDATLNFNEEIFYAQGMGDAIPPYIALVLATPGIRPLKRLFMIAIGSGILILFRVILLIFYTYWSFFKGEFFGIFIIFFSGTFRIALPLLIWFLFANKQILPRGQ